MTIFEKIKAYSEGLDNELAGLAILVENLEVKDKEQKALDIALQQREVRVGEIEKKALEQTHLAEDQIKANRKEKEEIELKWQKLQNEWQRMSEEREKLDRDKEEAAKEKLRIERQTKDLEAREKVIEDKTVKTASLDTLLKKKQEALEEQAVGLKLKQKKLDIDRQKVDKYFNS